ncbi:hypothetical protein CDO73_22830 [Saccharibacillus sp. O23]|uniref:Yip1 family protein n=1 Tax=Saccharibacillus sp. O23 TaxID=2009338 RepID=UPI000B4E0984|nr:Yip1 family protein [Saccharibacillus sp. O23]OWR27091.1 hypothetical protein CDO73_22830 [Saccharibacillus sp. O23]
MDGRYGGSGGDDDRARRAARREDDGPEGGGRPRIELDKRPGGEPYRDAYRDDRDRQGPYRQDPYRRDPYREDRYRDDRYRHAGNGRISRADYVPSGLSPWRHIWLHPRLVARDFLYSADPLRNALLLALIAGCFTALNTASTRNWGDDMSTGGLIASVVIVGLIGGLLTYYLGAWLLKVVGGWLGGVASTSEMRIISGRIQGMLSIMVGLFWIPELLIAGKENFTLLTPVLDANLTRSLLYFGVSMLELAGSVWSGILILHATGEIHGFSAWKALLMYVIVTIIGMLIAFILIFLVIMIVGTVITGFSL